MSLPTVTFHYTLRERSGSGDILDCSQGLKQPLTILPGYGEVVPCVDEKLVAMCQSEQEVLSFTVPAAEIPAVGLCVDSHQKNNPNVPTAQEGHERGQCDTIHCTLRVLEQQRNSENTELLSIGDMKLKCAQDRKLEGNKCFTNGETDLALEKYRQALSYLNLPENCVYEPKMAMEAASLMAVLYTNLSAVHLQLEQYKFAWTASDKAIEANPKHTKAFFRRAQAMESLGEIEQAKESLIQAAELSPQDTKIRGELERISKKIKLKKKAEKEAMAKAFN